MKATRIVAVLLISIGMQGQQTPPASSISVTTPGQTPVYRINLRVHNGHSTLAVADLRSSLEELNFIWWSQAGVCFEIMSSKGDTTAADGFDIWFVPAVPDPPGVNGVYKSDHNIWSRDYPNLRPASNPVTHRAARTGAHELGHGLTLRHYDGYPDSTDSLMASGTLGWRLQDFQIRAARTRAQQKATPDTTPMNCGMPQIN